MDGKYGSICRGISFFLDYLVGSGNLITGFAYTAQKWAYKCYKELVTLNKTLLKVDEKLQLLKMRS